MNYLAAQRSIYEKLSKDGCALPCKRIGKVYDPTTGKTSDAGSLDQELVGIALTPKTSEFKGDTDLIEALTEGRLKKFTFAVYLQSFRPCPGDLITWDSELWTIKNSDTIKPGTIALLQSVLAIKHSLSAVDQVAVPVEPLEQSEENLSNALNFIS
jgi:hypothetical protein